MNNKEELKKKIIEAIEGLDDISLMELLLGIIIGYNRKSKGVH